MARRKGRHHRQPDGVPGAALRPMTYAAILSAAIAAATNVGAPAYGAVPESAAAHGLVANPGVGPAQPPDGGVEPQIVGALWLPAAAGPVQAAPAAAPVLGPLAKTVNAKEIEVARLAEQLKRLGIDKAGLDSELTATRSTWDAAAAVTRRAQEISDKVAGEAYKAAAGQLPGTADGLRGLNPLFPVHDEDLPATTESAARDLLRAQDDERVAYQAYQTAQATANSYTTRYNALQATYNQKNAALQDLKKRNSAQLAEITKLQEEWDTANAARYLGTVHGWRANDKALAAVRYAERQLGKPYVWGAEGPYAFDCSGLVYASYRAAGFYGLPRVAKDQFYDTRSRPVAFADLLPGDLLFYSTSQSDWRQIYHVTMYIGGGKMIQSPTTGDHVRISPLHLENLTWATRVLDAVRVADDSGATAAPPTTATQTPTTTPTSPTATPTPSPTRTRHPKPTPSASATPSEPPPTTTEPSPSPTPTPTDSATTTPTPEATESTSPTATADGFAGDPAAS